MRLALTISLAACAGASVPARVTTPPAAEPAPTLVAVPIAIAPSPIGTRRTVRYRFESFGHGFRDRALNPPTCTELVLAETVTRADAEREFELAVEIVGGNDRTLCDVGRKVAVVAPADDAHRVAVTADAVLQDTVLAAITSLHEDLGRRNGAFHVSGGLPWEQPPRRVELAGVAYLDSERTESYTFGPLPSRGNATSTAKLRRRDGDRVLVCASVTSWSEGENFEYGAWVTGAFESIAVDAADCP